MTAVFVGEPTPTAETTPIDQDRAIADRVLDRLGRPRDLFRVQVRSLWGNHFRVNVYREVGCTERIPRVEMTDSFFVTKEGPALLSQPAIERKY